MTGVEKREGIVYHAVSGFYYVWADDESYTTKPKGVFRHQDVKPMVGDYVEFEIDHQDNHENRLTKILPRKNELKRPPITNVDKVFVVMSLTEPDFSPNLLDHFLLFFEWQQIEPIIILTKADLYTTKLGQEQAEAQIQSIKQIYEQQAGYTLFVIGDNDEQIDLIRQTVKKATYFVAGQSGVGKSTLINHLIPQLNIETNEISSSLNRGKHTTRSVRLYPLNDGLIADTPGFSSIDVSEIPAELIQTGFPEIEAASHYCKFSSCMHINEPHCNVKKSVEQAQIAQSRYDNYVAIYRKIANQKPTYK